MIAEVKTNVMRVLDKQNIPYTTHFYDPDNGIDGHSVATNLGEDPQCVFKTLVTQGKSRNFYVFVVPVTGTLNLKAAARACGEKAIDMIPQKLLLPNTGYVHGGCSPIGMKKLYPTFIDETAQLFDEIYVSAGKIGVQVQLRPDDLCQITQAVYAPIADL